jgi:hypothetical protein
MMDTSNFKEMFESDGIKRLRAELEGVHSCGPTCTRVACLNRRLREKLTIAEEALDSAGRYICLAVPFSDGVTRQISEALTKIRSE